MYYIPELLKRRSGGQLSLCWLAATLNENQFKKICRTPKLHLINIEKLCDDIISGTKSHEYSLYLSSQLMGGVSNLQLYKSRALEASCKQLHNDMKSELLPKKGKLKRKSKAKRNPFNLPQLAAEIPEPPPFSEQFLIDLEQPDRHLITEVDGSLGHMGHDLCFQDVDDFGQREFDRLNEDSLAALSRGDGLFADNENDNPNEGTFRGENIPEQYPMVLSTLNLNQEVLRTPTKRARGTHADTPSKRRREARSKSVENQENIPPTDKPKNVSPRRSLILVNPPSPPRVDDNFDGVQITQDDIPTNLVTQMPEPTASDSRSSVDLIFGPLRLNETLTRRRMKRFKFIDELTRIPNDDFKKRIDDPYIMTHRDKSLVNINRICLDSQLLFNRPSTSCRFKLNFMWSNVLQKSFLKHIEGPFQVDNDESLFAVPESVRVDITTDVTAELSDEIDKNKFLLPAHPEIRTTDTVSHVLDDEIPLPEVPHETTEFETAAIPDQPYVGSGCATILENQSHSASHDRLRSKGTRREVLRGQSRSSSGDKTVDINNIPSSSSPRSDSSMSSVGSSTKKLRDELKKRWDEKLQQYPVQFAEVFPPAITLKSVAARGTLDLMYLATNGEVSIQQAESNTAIYIYLDFD